MLDLRRFKVALVLLLALGVAACDTPEEREAKYLDRAVGYMDEGELNKALVNFRNVLKLNPQNAQALYLVGTIREERDEYQKAYAAYLAAVGSDATLLDAHVRLGLLNLLGQNFDLVRERIEAMRQIDPGNVDAMALDASLQLRDDNLEGAEKLARAALATDPSHVNALSALVGVYAKRNDIDGAVQLIDERFETFGPDVPLALLKIQLLSRDGTDPRLEAAYAQLVEFDPTNPGFRLALSNYFRGRDDLASAESVLREALAGTQLERDSVESALVVLVYQARGLEAAAAEVERLTESGQGQATLPFLLADLNLREGRYDAARAILTDVIDNADENSPVMLDALTAIATVDLTETKDADAKIAVDRVLAADKEHRGANYLRGIIAVRNGDFEDAVVYGRASLQRDPSWVAGLKLTAEGYLRLNQTELALDQLTRIVELAPNDLESAEVLARLLTERGDFDAAMDVWQVIGQRSQDPAPALQNTAELAIRQSNWGRAQADINTLLQNDATALAGTVLAGSMEVARGDFDAGREWFERAADLNPGANEPMIGIVRAYIAAEDFAAAEEFLLERLAADPDNFIARNVLAQVQVRQGDRAGAIETYRGLIEARPDWITPYRGLAALLEQEGEVNEAIAVFERAAENNEGNADLALEKAMVYQRADRWLEALDIYDALLAAGVSSDLIINNFSAIVADHNADNTTRLERAVALATPFQTSQNAMLLDTLGWVLYRAGDPVQGLNYLRRAVALLPGEPQLRYHLGAVYYAVGDESQALNELALAIVDPDNPYPGFDEAQKLHAELLEKGSGDASR